MKHRSGQFSRAETTLLVLVILAGGAVTAASRLSAEVGRALGQDASYDVWTVTGNSFAYSETLEIDLPSDGLASNIEVVNYYGDVEIRPHPENRLTLIARKDVRASSQEEADRLNAEFSFRATQGPDGMVIRAGLDEGVRPAPRLWFRSRLTLWVPPEVHTRVVNRWGDVIVDESLSVETDLQHGKIRQR